MDPVVLQKMAGRKLPLQNPHVYRVEHPHRPIQAIQRALETVFITHLLDKLKRVLVGDPASINRIHKDAILLKLLSTCPCDHVEGSLRHIGVGMVLAFVAPVENTLHRRYVDDPRGRIPHHLALELADEVEGNYRIHNLSSIAVQQRHVLNRLDPCVHLPLVDRLPELVALLQLYVPLLQSYGVGEDRRVGVLLERFDYTDLIMFLVFNSQLLILQLFVEKLFRTDNCLSGVVDQDVKFLHVSLHIVNESLHLRLRYEITLNDFKSVLPFTKIFLGLVSTSSIAWETRCYNNSRPVLQKPQSHLETNFYPSTRYQSRQT